MFAVDDIEDVLARLHAHGAGLAGDLGQYAERLPALLRPRSRRRYRPLAGQLSWSVQPG